MRRRSSSICQAVFNSANVSAYLLNSLCSSGIHHHDGLPPLQERPNISLNRGQPLPLDRSAITRRVLNNFYGLCRIVLVEPLLKRAMLSIERIKRPLACTIGLVTEQRENCDILIRWEPANPFVDQIIGSRSLAAL